MKLTNSKTLTCLAVAAFGFTGVSQAQDVNLLIEEVPSGYEEAQDIERQQGSQERLLSGAIRLRELMSQLDDVGVDSSTSGGQDAEPDWTQGSFGGSARERRERSALFDDLNAEQEQPSVGPPVSVQHTQRFGDSYRAEVVWGGSVIAVDVGDSLPGPLRVVDISRGIVTVRGPEGEYSIGGGEIDAYSLWDRLGLQE